MRNLASGCRGLQSLPSSVCALPSHDPAARGGQVRGELGDGVRQMLGALITLDVHARDVVQELVDAGGCRLVARGHWRGDNTWRQWGV